LPNKHSAELREKRKFAFIVRGMDHCKELSAAAAVRKRVLAAAMGVARWI